MYDKHNSKLADEYQKFHNNNEPFNGRVYGTFIDSDKPYILHKAIYYGWQPSLSQHECQGCAKFL